MSVVAAPRDKDSRVVPTRFTIARGPKARCACSSSLPFPPAAVAEGALSNQARAAHRQEITDTASRVLSRLTPHPHRVLRRYLTAPVIALAVGPTALQELEASSPLVKRVTEDMIHRPVLPESVPLIGADKAWAQGFDGTGLVVAVIDSGVDSAHPFLAGKVVEEACYSTTSAGQSTTLCPNGAEEQIGPGAGVHCPLEPAGCWHGTHVAGIAAGNGTPPTCRSRASGKGARHHGGPGLLTDQRVPRLRRRPPASGRTRPISSPPSSASTRCVTTHAFAAVNMSLGGGLFSATCDDEPYKPFIDNLRAAGIATVVAAGNDGSHSTSSARRRASLPR